MIKERIKGLGDKKVIGSLFKELVPEESDESEPSKSSQSEEDDFYDQVSDHEGHEPKIKGLSVGRGIPRPRKADDQPNTI